MKGFALLPVILMFQKHAALHFKDRFGLDITYDVTFESKCRNDEGRFRKMLGIGLSDCVRECGLRPHCEALSYRGQMLMCDLFSTTVEGTYSKGACIYISGSGIKFKKTPCGKCSYGQLCDMHSKQCTYKECIPTRINNGIVLGNLNEVGSKIRYKCNHGYRDKNGIKSAVCKEDGTWNVTANCTRDCYVGHSWNYAGQKNVTVSGNRCQRWDAQSVFTNVNKFPESDLSEAENYCRNPSNWLGGPWCFTDVTTDRREKCDISEC